MTSNDGQGTQIGRMKLVLGVILALSVLEIAVVGSDLLGLHAAVRAHHPGLCTAEVDRIDAVGLLGDRCPLSRNDRASRAGRCCRGSGCGERDTEDNQQRNSDTTHGLIVRANGSREATGRVGT